MCFLPSCLRLAALGHASVSSEPRAQSQCLSQHLCSAGPHGKEIVVFLCFGGAEWKKQHVDSAHRTLSYIIFEILLSPSVTVIVMSGNLEQQKMRGFLGFLISICTSLVSLDVLSG